MLAESLAADGFAPATAGTAADAIERLDGFAYDCLVVDLRLPDADGMEVLAAALDRYPGILAVVITGFGGVNEAVAAIKRGALDFLIKPFQLGTARRASSRRRSSSAASGRRTPSSARTAPRPLPVRQHHRTERGDAARVLDARTRCADEQHRAHPGRDRHRQGTDRADAFTTTAHAPTSGSSPSTRPRSRKRSPKRSCSATRRARSPARSRSRVGRFELAHRGTLFIDEVGLMPLPLQSKLLRALQEREIERVGESRPIKFDARIVAASNHDLRKMVKEGTFREDLFYRLNVIPVTLPPLRERREDVPLLARHFVQKSCRSNNLPLKTLSQDAVRMLMSCAWPGNIRQLENAVEHAVAMSGAETEIPAGDPA